MTAEPAEESLHNVNLGVGGVLGTEGEGVLDSLGGLLTSLFLLIPATGR